MATSRYIIQNEHKYKDNKFLLPLLIAFFSGLGVAFSAGGFNYGRVFAVALVGIACLLNVENAFCLIVFAFPFSSMLKLSNETISILPVLYLVIILKIVAKGKLTIPPLSLVCTFLLAILQALCIAFYEAQYTGILSSLLNIAFVLFIADYMNKHVSDTQTMLPKASFCFAISTSLMLLLSDIFPELPMLVHAGKTSAVEAANRYAATVVDPNELAQIILIAIGLLIAVFSSLKSIPKKLFAVAMMVYMAITGVRTQSKSYVIAVVALFAFLAFTYIRTIAKREGVNKAAARLLPILLITIVGCVLLIVYVVIPVFEARSGENTSFLTGRDNIWTKYLDALRQRFDVVLFGCGSGNVTHLMKLVGRTGNGVPHNSYLEYVIQFGILGLILLFAAWKQAMTSIKEKMSTYYAIPLVAFLITAFGISVNASDCPFILAALLTLPLPNDVDQRVIQSNKEQI